MFGRNRLPLEMKLIQYPSYRTNLISFSCQLNVGIWRGGFDRIKHTCHTPGKFLKLRSATTATSALSILEVTVVPSSRVMNSRTAGWRNAPTSAAVKLIVPAIAGSRKVADDIVGYTRIPNHSKYWLQVGILGILMLTS